MKYAILDLETTGHSSEDDIIQVGVVIVSDNMEIVDTFSSFVKPTVPIPPFITQLTGITEEAVADAPELSDVLLRLIPLLDDAVLIAHNVGFDAGFLNQSLERCGYFPFTGSRLDTIELLRILYPSITTYQLGAVAELFGIKHEHHHRADSDALATAHIFIEAVNKLRSLPLLTLQRLVALIDESKDLHAFLRRQLAQLEQTVVFESNEFDYYRQFALKAGEWNEETPARQAAEEDPIPDDMTFDDYLDAVRTKFQERFQDYEEREPQTQMFHHVYQALTSDQHLMIEAGTGTGKSLGYLIPAMFYGVKSGSKIVVSTHTINLQEQLRGRDLPLLADVLPFPVRASIFKGRG
ncbi:MAG: DnaQ family exonuclease/DinG family helicase, partial [Paenibacillus sp.]|nr:DnaQ family exonuclease/DinG family helicase [Paenibacillus sp.]